MSTPARRRVLVLYGGRSSEHEVSCLSARSVLEVIDRDRYDVVTVGITKDGRWTLTDGRIAVRVGDPLPSVGDEGPTVGLIRDRTATRLVSLTDEGRLRDEGELDLAFPVLHGPFGEDGTVQGLLGTMQLPFVGAGVTASSIGVDKRAMKQAFAAADLPQLPHVVIDRREFTERPTDVMGRLGDTLGYPMFTKPSRLGSSIGITKATGPDTLRTGLEAALRYDGRVIVEQGLERPRELEIGLLETPDGDVETTPVGQIMLHHEFYDYGAKYLDDSELAIPAHLPEAVAGRADEIARAAWDALGCQGLGRVDVFVSDDDALYVNEINTIPDLRRRSVFPRLWEANGLGYEQLIDRLLRDAVARPSLPLVALVPEYS